MSRSNEPLVPFKIYAGGTFFVLAVLVLWTLSRGPHGLEAVLIFPFIVLLGVIGFSFMLFGFIGWKPLSKTRKVFRYLIPTLLSLIAVGGLVFLKIQSDRATDTEYLRNAQSFNDSYSGKTKF
jgi:hypothetical protein